ncbi:MAG: sugar phosphate nucleotidyltransferase [Ekhidna sp.]
MRLLILAAGRGSRYGEKKQYDGVGVHQEYLLEYNLYDAIVAGFSHLTIVCGPRESEDMVSYLMDRVPPHVKVIGVDQSLEDLPEGCQTSESRDKPWGTAHAVWSARNHLTEPFVTINADDYYGYTAFQEAAKQLSTSPSMAMIAFELSKTLSRAGNVSRGICEIENALLRSVTEYKTIGKKKDVIIDEISGRKFTGKELVSMNMWLLNDSIFSVIENQFRTFLEMEAQQMEGELYLPAAVQHLIDQNNKEVQVCTSNSKWMGLTFQEDREQVVKQLEKYTHSGRYPSPLWS